MGLTAPLPDAPSVPTLRSTIALWLADLTVYTQRAVDAIMRGDILLADSKDVPHRLAVFMRASLERRLPPA